MASFFLATDEKVKNGHVWFDSYGALMINRDIRILIEFQAYTEAVWHKLSTILKANVLNLARFNCLVNILIPNIVQVFCVFYLYIFQMIEFLLWDTVSMNLA